MKIIINDISFSYDLVDIIKAFSCTFESGNFYSILGPNGSGKTTLLDMISGFFKPREGCITMDDRNISTFEKNDLARKIALVSQNYYINFPYTVNEVVMMGRHPHIPRFSKPLPGDFEMVDKVMDKTGIRHLAHRKITELSGGEKQRSIFARALCQDTPILLLDEAFSNMDISHTVQMLSFLKEMVKKKNLLVICVFHDLNMASTWSDSMAFLKKGKVETFGNTSTVMTEDNIKTVFNIETKVEFNEYVQAKQAYYKVSKK
jgi:iron complex transport system ATP-binding protein